MDCDALLLTTSPGLRLRGAGLLPLTVTWELSNSSPDLERPLATGLPLVLLDPDLARLSPNLICGWSSLGCLRAGLPSLLLSKLP